MNNAGWGFSPSCRWFIRSTQPPRHEDSYIVSLPTLKDATL